MKQILFWCLFVQALHAQQPGFNKGYDFGYYINLFNDVTVQNDTLIAYGLAQDTVWPYKQAVLVARFDTLGVPLDHVLVQDTGFNLYSLHYDAGKIIATSDGGYAMTTITIYGGDAVLIKLDRHLGVEFVSKFQDTINGSEFLIAPIEVSDGFLLYGYFLRAGNGKHDAILRKVDKQGNLIWRKSFGEIDWSESFRWHAQVNDTTILLSGLRELDPFIQGQALPFVYILNDNGEILNSWTSNTLQPFNGMEIGRFHKSNDDKWLAFGSKYLGKHPEFNFDRFELFWVKLNQNYEMEWAKSFGPKVANTSAFYDVIQTPNHDLIGIGKRGPFDFDPDTYYQKGWIMRFSPEADSIWEWTGKMPIDNPKAHLFAGGALLPSGSIVAAGEGYTPEGALHCWLVKLSPDGCLDTLFCNPAVSVAPEPVLEAQVQVFPNPAVGQMSVQLDNIPAASLVQLCDLMGRVVHRWPANQAVYALEGIAPGLYVVQVLSAQGQVLASRRLVVAGQ